MWTFIKHEYTYINEDVWRWRDLACVSTGVWCLISRWKRCDFPISWSREKLLLSIYLNSLPFNLDYLYYLALFSTSFYFLRFDYIDPISPSIYFNGGGRGQHQTSSLSSSTSSFYIYIYGCRIRNYPSFHVGKGHLWRGSQSSSVRGCMMLVMGVSSCCVYV